MADMAGITQRFEAVRGALDERSRRLVAAAEVTVQVVAAVFKSDVPGSALRCDRIAVAR
jgi:hypothetical protein